MVFSKKIRRVTEQELIDELRRKQNDRHTVERETLAAYASLVADTSRSHADFRKRVLPIVERAMNDDLPDIEDRFSAPLNEMRQRYTGV